MVLSITHLLLPAYSTFLACTAKVQLPSTIAKMDSESIPTKATHTGPLPSFTAGKHHSMVTVSLYLAIKVIHSPYYTADLLRITHTACPEANKLLVQREINPPRPSAGLSNYVWNAFALTADLGGGHCTTELIHTKAPPQIWESYRPFKNRLTMPGSFLRTGRCLSIYYVEMPSLYIIYSKYLLPCCWEIQIQLT